METFKFKTKSITGNTPLAALRAIWVPNTSNEVLKSLLFFDTFVKYSYKNYKEFLIAKRIDVPHTESQISDIKQLLCIVRELREMWLYNFIEQQQQPFNIRLIMRSYRKSNSIRSIVSALELGSNRAVALTIRIIWSGTGMRWRICAACANYFSPRPHSRSDITKFIWTPSWTTILITTMLRTTARIRTRNRMMSKSDKKESYLNLEIFHFYFQFILIMFVFGEYLITFFVGGWRTK